MNGTTNTNTAPEEPFSYETFRLIELAFNVILSGCFGLFGVGANIINIIVFYRQGPTSSSSTTFLFGLAISDLCVCILAVFSAGLVFVQEFIFDKNTWNWHVGAVRLILVQRPFNLFPEITCWITTFLTLERAISVILPFKVKSIFTSNRCLVVVMVIFVLVFFTQIPNLFGIQFYWAYRPSTNSTYLTVGYNSIFPDIIFTIYHYMGPTFSQFFTLSAVVAFNSVIAWKVKASHKFRSAKSKSNLETLPQPDANTNTNTNTTTGDPKSKELQGASKLTKEVKLQRMIFIVAFVFSICNMVNVLQTIFMYLVFEYHKDYHWYWDAITFDLVTSLQIFNSSINIVIYFNMSTRYREELTLCWQARKKTT